MDKKSAVEMMDFNPFLGPLLDSDDPRPAENKRIKECFELYLSIGFYRDLDQPDGSQMRYYVYEDRHKPMNEITTYSSLLELEQALQTDADRKDIFRNNPKVFIEGHGGDNRYGVGGDHPKREGYNHYLEQPYYRNDPSEQIHGDNFDKIINDLRDVINPNPGELSITLEVCNADNLYLGKSLWGHNKTFLKSLSESHQDITFSGTGPWDTSHNNAAIETGTRSPGGVNTPIISMGGNIWKPGNTIAFYNKFTINDDVSDYQVVVKKSKFASTQTAKELKINTVNYAAKILENTTLRSSAKKRILQNISENPKILKIDDLKIMSDFPADKSETKEATLLSINENKIITNEKDAYIQLAQKILAKGDKADQRDILDIALGLKDFADNGSQVKGTVFEGHERLLDDILANTRLLELVMVSCGKVLIATPSNNNLIDLLKSKNISVNSADEFGMTAMHYAVQNFYIYRDETLNLVRKLLDCGANLEAENNELQTPVMLGDKHSQKEIVIGGENLRELLQLPSLTAQPTSDTVAATLLDQANAAPKLEQSAVGIPDVAKAMQAPQPSPSARDDESSIAVLTRGFGFISQNTVAQRAQLDMAAADSVDQKNDTTLAPGK
ncbi:MAG: hypothetical protein NTU49_00400 [Gammaproteobacteria bacterium]|nr:hypothetical protein [Gammaproteobacteria bacterium]